MTNCLRLQGLLLLLTLSLQPPLLVPNRSQKVMLTLQLTVVLHPSDLVLYSSGVFHLSTSPRGAGIKHGERNPRPLLHKYPKQDALFSNRAPSKGHEGRSIHSLLGTVYTIFFNCEL